jgi:hypothetical protein
VKLRAVVITLSLLLLVAAAPVADTANASPQPVADWTYQGCFSLTGSTPCYDVYTHNGAYWMCSACRTTKRPSQNSCRELSAAQMANGRWCS